jgi:hypothetical protein
MTSEFFLRERPQKETLFSMLFNISNLKVITFPYVLTIAWDQTLGGEKTELSPLAELTKINKFQNKYFIPEIGTHMFSNSKH